MLSNKCKSIENWKLTESLVFVKHVIIVISGVHLFSAVVDILTINFFLFLAAKCDVK